MNHDEQNDQRLSSAVWEARREINIRIVVQNIIIMLQIVMIVGLTLASGLRPGNLSVIWFTGMVGSLMFGQAWLHSGIRHAQYRAFFCENLDRHLNSDFVPWETFLKALRPPGPLGSHWYISTKALFAGSHLSILAAAAIAWKGSLLRDTGFQILLVIALATTVASIFILRHPSLPSFDPEASGLKKR